MFSKEVIKRAEDIVFGNYPAVIVGLASDFDDVSNEDWHTYWNLRHEANACENIAELFSMFVLEVEGLL